MLHHQIFNSDDAFFICSFKSIVSIFLAIDELPWLNAVLHHQIKQCRFPYNISCYRWASLIKCRTSLSNFQFKRCCFPYISSDSFYRWASFVKCSGFIVKFSTQTTSFPFDVSKIASYQHFLPSKSIFWLTQHCFHLFLQKHHVNISC